MEATTLLPASAPGAPSTPPSASASASSSTTVARRVRSLVLPLVAGAAVAAAVLSGGGGGGGSSKADQLANVSWTANESTRRDRANRGKHATWTFEAGGGAFMSCTGRRYARVETA